MSLTPAGERLLAAAAELFYRRGIRAVGVDLIAETAGTTKKTLYDCFGSKDALVALYLEHRMARWQAFLAERMASVPPGPDRAPAVFDVLGEWLADADRGCGFVNAYAELGGTGHPGEAVVRAEKAAMRRYFVELVVEEGLPAQLGAELHLLYEGASVMATAGGDPEAVERAREAARRIVHLAGRPVAEAPAPA
ncbi:TetR/AcrR family transcriptional regulator [Pseudonocardia sp. CA-107938]|uniref:TetR/AcrR family transcriptional regulator n=1 Tax=Pseudonocardia sp. CA-107938 TaxID=3240021 RepID=UPI003D8E065D